MCGSTVSEVPRNELEWAIQQRIAIRSKNDPKLAHVKPQYRFWVDAQTGVLGFALTERPESAPEDRALRSSFWLVLRHALFYGTADSMLWELHDAVHVACTLPHSIQVEGLQ